MSLIYEILEGEKYIESLKYPIIPNLNVRVKEINELTTNIDNGLRQNAVRLMAAFESFRKMVNDGTDYIIGSLDVDFAIMNGLVTLRNLADGTIQHPEMGKWSAVIESNEENIREFTRDKYKLIGDELRIQARRFPTLIETISENSLPERLKTRRYELEKMLESKRY